MTDIVPKAKRSEMMAGIRGKNTKPELLIRSGLHNMGFRYRLHDSRLPGKPDIVLPKYKAIVLVNGCFWHMHECSLFKWPQTRPEFWRNKLQTNKDRDKALLTEYSALGWRTFTVWECTLKGKSRFPLDDLLGTIAKWLLEGTGDKELP